MRGNTLRLRLTRSEVDQIGEGEAVTEATQFPGGLTLQYSLVPGEIRNAELATSPEGQAIRVEVPAEMATEWATSQTQVGFSGETPFAVGPLEILIEKDFTCITPREGEEELDTFPNPNAVNG